MHFWAHKLKLDCESEYGDHAVSEPVCDYFHRAHESVKVASPSDNFFNHVIPRIFLKDL